MSEKIKGLVKNKNNLVVLVLVGVLLMVIALPLEKKDTGNDSDDFQNKNNSSYQNGSTGVNHDLSGTGTERTVQEYTDLDGLQLNYATQMEQKLEEVLAKMEGAGKVRVFITLQSSEELIVEKDAPVNRSNTAELDSQGGSRTVNNVDAGESTVYATEGNASVPYVVKTVTPRVEGVLVLAQGAGNGTVNKNIVDAVQVLFGIEAHQVKVMKMETLNSQE